MAHSLRDSLTSGHLDLGPGTWVLLTECALESRIPDVVLARLDVDAIWHRWHDPERRALSRTEAQLMRLLRRDRTTRLETILRRSPISSSHVRRVLAALARDGFAEGSAVTGYRRNIDLRQIATKVISIEAKRSSWRNALVQARAHQHAVSSAYVAYDATYERRFSNAAAYYRASGIGLLELCAATGTIIRRLVPRRSPWRDASAGFYAAECVWAELLGHRITPLPETRLPGGVGRSERRALLLSFELESHSPTRFPDELLWRLAGPERSSPRASTLRMLSGSVDPPRCHPTSQAVPAADAHSTDTSSRRRLVLR